MSQKPIRVLVADDSALMREMISTMLSSDPGIEVVGAVPDPIVARDKIKQLNPDVLTLDIEMPRMDGISFLEKIMALRPMPVVMISSLTQEGAEATLRALELGAVDFVAKPAINLQSGLLAKQAEIVSKVKAAARAHVRRLAPLAADSTLAKRPPGYSSTEKVIVIGASTGGVEALNEVILHMPSDSPAILITQHMPEQFTASFARRLDSAAAMRVSEARDGERVLPGHAYIAQGDRHLRLGRSGSELRLQRERDRACQRPLPFGRCAVSLGGGIRRKKRHRRHFDRHGQGWRATACSPCARAVPAHLARMNPAAWSTACRRWRSRLARSRPRCRLPKWLRKS